MSRMVVPWRHYCAPILSWASSETETCPRCGKRKPLNSRIDEDYIDSKREELRDEYRTGLDSPPE
jgi:hypothetical protein